MSPRRLDLDETELVRLYESGISTVELARREGCSVHAVADRLHSLDVRMRPPGEVRARIDDEWLRRAYADDGIRAPELAKLLGVGKSTVYRKLRYLGIESRSRAAVSTDEERAWLRNAYVVEKMRLASIAAELGCSKQCVFRTLRRMGIEPRTNGVLESLTSVDTDWLRTQYAELGRSSYEIAADIGCNSKTVWRMLRDRGIPTRSRSEVMRATGRLQWWGEQNPNYRDGSSNERDLLEIQHHWDDVRLVTYTRDQFKCRRCGDRSHGPGTLHAHHRRPWAGHPELRFDQGNLVTLCRTCHRWVHSRANRESAFLDSSR